MNNHLQLQAGVTQHIFTLKPVSHKSALTRPVNNRLEARVTQDIFTFKPVSHGGTRWSTELKPMSHKSAHTRPVNNYADAAAVRHSVQRRTEQRRATSTLIVELTDWGDD